MNSVRATPTPTLPPLLAREVIRSSPKSLTPAGSFVGCSMGVNGRPPGGHVLALPTELLAVIFELASEESPFLLAKEARLDHAMESELKSVSNVSSGEVKQDPSSVVDEVHCTVPMDKWDYPLPLAISQTCNRFRSIALSIPMLWSRISIYRERSVEGWEAGNGEKPQRWCRARLYLSRATRPFLNSDGTLKHGVDKGILDIRIFAAMYTRDDWPEAMINERWFGASDIEEASICDFLLPFASLFRSFTLSADSWEPIYTFIHRSSHLRAPNLERIEFVRTNTFPGKQVEFYPQHLAQPLKLFCGKTDDEGFVEEGCLGRLREVILAGVHLDWQSFLTSMLTEHGGMKYTNLEALYLNYQALNVRPSLPLFLSFLTASPYLESLGLQAGGPDPFSTERYDLDPSGDYVAPWTEIHPPHPHIPTLSNLRTLVLKFLNPEEAVEILAVMKSVLERSGGRLNGLKTLHLGDLAGSPEWQEEEPSLLPLVGELGKILPVPVPTSEDGRMKDRGLTALSLTGFKDRYSDDELKLDEGGFTDGIKALASLDVFNSVCSLRIVFCDSHLFDALCPQLCGSTEKQLSADPTEHLLLPMPELSSLWLERCDGTGFRYYDEERSDPKMKERIVAPLKSMLVARRISCPKLVSQPQIEVLGYSRKDVKRLSNPILSEIRPYVRRMILWGREEGEAESSVVDEPMTREEEDEILMREADEYDDPEFEYLCELAYRQPEQGVGAEDDNYNLEMEVPDLLDPDAVVGTPLPVPLTISNPTADAEEPIVDEAVIPTPRDPYQSFNIDPLANYHRYMTGTWNDGGVGEAEDDCSLDADCSVSTSTHTSAVLFTPSTSASSLPTSTAPSEASSECGDHESEDTALPPDEMEKVGVFYTSDVDFELDNY